MSQSVTYRTQVGASATIANALADTPLERAPGWGFVTVIGRHETTSTGEILASFFRGSEELVTEATMTANDNMNPNVEDDVILGPIPVKPGDYLRLRLRETTGNATDLRVKTEFQEASPAAVLAAAAGAM